LKDGEFFVSFLVVKKEKYKKSKLKLPMTLIFKKGF